MNDGQRIGWHYIELKETKKVPTVRTETRDNFKYSVIDARLNNPIFTTASHNTAWNIGHITLNLLRRCL